MREIWCGLQRDERFPGVKGPDLRGRLTARGWAAVRRFPKPDGWKGQAVVKVSQQTVKKKKKGMRQNKTWKVTVSPQQPEMDHPGGAQRRIHHANPRRQPWQQARWYQLTIRPVFTLGSFIWNSLWGWHRVCKAVSTSVLVSRISGKKKKPNEKNPLLTTSYSAEGKRADLHVIQAPLSMIVSTHG